MDNVINAVSVLDVIDRDSNQNAQVIIRPVKGYIAFTLTLEHEGDVQVVMSAEECAELIGRLQTAVTEVRSEALVTAGGTSGNRQLAAAGHE